MTAAPRDDPSCWDRAPADLLVVAGRVDVLARRVREARGISARRFALDALARGLLNVDPGAVDEETLAEARAARVDGSTLAAATVPRLPHAVGVPFVAREQGLAFVRQVHVTYDPGGVLADDLLGPVAKVAAARAISMAAQYTAPLREPPAHALVAARPEVLRGARVDGESLAAAAFVSAVSLWTGRPTRAGIVVTGALRGDRLASVGDVMAKVRAARSHGAEMLLLPKADEAAGRAVGEVEVRGIDTLDALLEAALEPSGSPVGDAEKLVGEARALARSGWRGYQWPSVREQLARISVTLPPRRFDLRVEVLTRLAAAQRHCGDPLGCLELLHRASSMIRSAEGQVSVPDGPVVDVWIQTAMTHRQLCQFADAGRAAELAVRTARRARLRGRLIKALGTAGLVWMARGRPARAVSLFAESLEHTMAHQPHDAARSRAYLIEAYAASGQRAEAADLLDRTLEEVRDPTREAWVRTSGAATLLVLERPADAVTLLDTPGMARSLVEEPLPGLLARRWLGLGLIRSGSPLRGYEVLGASPLVHGRALAPHLAFLAHLNVLFEASERIVRDDWDADIAGRAREAIEHLPRYGAAPRFLGRPLATTRRMLGSNRQPRGSKALQTLLTRCARLA